jgi:hypothetical protein
MCIIAILATIAAVAFWERERAVVQRNLALSQANRSRANLAVSLGNRSLQTDPARAVAFGLQSLTLSPNQGAQTLISDAIRELPSYTVWTHPAAQNSDASSLLHEKPLLQGAGFIGKGHTLAILDKEGALYIWDMTAENTVSRRIALSDAQEISLSKEHQRLTVLDRSGKIELFKLDSESKLVLLKQMQGHFPTLSSRRTANWWSV